MLSCFGGCGGYSEPRSLAACDKLLWLFDVLLFHPRLSFLRSDDPDEGVVGSSGLDSSVWVSVLTGALASFGALGPVSLGGL